MELQSLCKYFSSSPEVLTGIFGNRKIRFTQPWGLNDPLEGAPSARFQRPGTDTLYQLDGVTYPSEQLFYRIQVIEAAVNSFGMLSLTKIPDSFDMWALYGDGHRGFLIEFAEDFNEKPCMRARDGGVYPVEPVDYVETYEIDPDDLYDGQTINHQALIRSVFLRKVKRWDREREFRIVRPLTDCADYTRVAGFQTSYRDGRVYLFDLDPGCIASVTFGAHMSSEAKRYVYSQVQGTGIELFQACLCLGLKDDAGHQGRLVLAHMDEFGAPERVLDSPPHHFSALDGDPREEKRTQTINTLAELPYYGRFRGVVERFSETMGARDSRNSQC